MSAILLYYLSGVVVVGVFAAIGWILWDRRYRGAVGGSFQRTDEVFRDPGSGKSVRVYEDPSTGKRQYRDEP